MARRSDGRSALDRAVSVLEAFPRGASGLPMSQVALRASLSLPTAYRIVGELVELGLLERAGTEVRLGVRLWELAHRVPRALSLRDAALPFMDDVQAATRQHVQMGVLEGTEVLFLERLSARASVVNFTIIGGRLPLHASSSGLVLLAHSDTEFQERILAMPRKQFTPNTITNEARLRRVLAGIRAQGFVACPGHLHPDAMGIAVPIIGADGTVVAALSVVVPVSEAKIAVHVMGLQTAAQGIARTLRSTSSAV